MWRLKGFNYIVKTKITRWVAHRLPKRLKYFVAIDILAHATTGKYSNTVVPDLTIMEAIRRFGWDLEIS